MTNIVFVGFQGVGKSFFGKKLSALLSRKFIDTDVLIEKHFGNRWTNREIFLHLGEEAFRELEKEIIKSLTSEKEAVIATGGGVVEIKGLKSLLQNLGSVLYLKETLPILQKRWDNTPRIYLGGRSLEEMYQRRDLMYKQVAHEEVEGKWDQILLAGSLQSQLLENPMEKGLGV